MGTVPVPAQLTPTDRRAVAVAALRYALQQLQDLHGYTRQRVDTLVGPDGQTVRHHFSGGQWEIHITPAGRPTRTLRYTADDAPTWGRLVEAITSS